MIAPSPGRSPTAGRSLHDAPPKSSESRQRTTCGRSCPRPISDDMREKARQSMDAPISVVYNPTLLISAQRSLCEGASPHFHPDGGRCRSDRGTPSYGGLREGGGPTGAGPPGTNVRCLALAQPREPSVRLSCLVRLIPTPPIRSGSTPILGFRPTTPLAAGLTPVRSDRQCRQGPDRRGLSGPLPAPGPQWR